MSEPPTAVGDPCSPRVSLIRWLALIYATGFGTGYSPLIPGTVGSLPAVVLVLLSAPWIEPGDWLTGPAVVLLLGFLGIGTSTVAEGVFGRKDDRRIVVDEIVGYMVTMLWNPLTAATLILGFLLSRFFDIVKPFPAHRSQRLQGGWGIVADDFIAGVYANVALRLVVFFLL